MKQIESALERARLDFEYYSKQVKKNEENAKECRANGNSNGAEMYFGYATKLMSQAETYETIYLIVKDHYENVYLPQRNRL